MPKWSIMEERLSGYKFRYLDLQEAAKIAEMTVKEEVRPCAVLTAEGCGYLKPLNASHH